MSDLIEDDNKFKKGWTGGLPETVCGFGSKVKSTERQRQFIPEIIEKYGIKSIGDIGAGDLNWIKVTDIPTDVEYHPYDLIPRYESVVTFDIRTDVAPKHDLLMLLWVLNHMSDDEAKKAIENIKDSSSKYLLITQRPGYYIPELDIIDTLVINGKGDLMLLVKL